MVLFRRKKMSELNDSANLRKALGIGTALAPLLAAPLLFIRRLKS